MSNPTYTRKPIPPNPGPEDNLGGQVVDGNRIAIQGLGSGFVTSDASGTAVTSPVSLTSSVTTITVPTNAIRMSITNSGATNAISVSEQSSMTTSFTLNTGATTTIDVGRMGKIYLSSAVGSTCSFYFSVVD